MARPVKSLLQRCHEQSFRARHHEQLLRSEPDLGCATLAELQQRAREASSDDELRVVARQFQETLSRLPAGSLPAASRLAGLTADQPSEREVSPEVQAEGRLLADVAAVLAEL